MKFKNGQEVFDHVINHLVTQGQRCYDAHTDVCLYRSPEGMSCAVGCLMSDEEYHPDMENEEVYSIIGKFDKIKWMNKYCWLLTDLQDLHDEGLNWNDNGGLSPTGLKDIQIIANSYGLNNPLQSENT